MDLLSPEILVFLFLIACVAGFIDTLAGGGGLITVPALMMSGVPPLTALATNKLQGTIGTATATYTLIKKQLLHWHDIKTLMPFACLGSMMGTLLIQFIDAHTLSFAIPIVLMLIALYFILANVQEASERKISPKLYKFTVVPGIGCYDGALGPGTGSFYSAAGSSLMGLSLLQATVQAKPLNFATNIASLVVFLIAGKIAWVIGGIMMLGQGIGAAIGSRCLIRIPYLWLRVLVVTMCVGMLIRFFMTMT